MEGEIILLRVAEFTYLIIFQASLHSSGFSQAYDNLRRDAYSRQNMEQESIHHNNNNQV